MTSPDSPLISVVRGRPAEDEVAALVVVLGLARAAVSGQQRIESPAKLSPWSN